MNNISNKEVVTKMYQTFLNEKRFEALEHFIDPDYLEVFEKANMPLMLAFPSFLKIS